MKQRIEKLLGLLEERGLSALYVTGPENRLYLSGFSGSTGALFITGEAQYLIVDFRYTVQAQVESPHLTVIELAAGRSFGDALAELLEKHRLKSVGCEGDHLTLNQFESLKKKLSGTELIATSGLVEGLRVVKEGAEVELIEEAVRLAELSFKEVLPLLRPGVSERELAAELEYRMRRYGAEGTAFKAIVASGHRSALPHGVASDKKVQAGDLVTLDFGAVYRGYCSDITRTVVVGRPDDRQKEIYSVVLTAQQKALSGIRAGVKACEVDAWAREVIEAAGYGHCFGHSTGHGVGLCVHEAPRLASGEDTVLAGGMVVTVEPGIYLPGWGGVRIEDTVLVTEGGCRILSSLPKEEIPVLC